ncbi:MAG TPA: DUF5673 domain-containing protein [Clostridia bacterium]
MPKILISLLSSVAGIVLAGTVFFLVKTIKHQHRLKYSITIISLKTNKFFYWLLDILLAFTAIICIFLMIEPEGKFLTKELYSIWNMNTLYVRITMLLLFIIICCIMSISIMMTIAKSAVVNDGIYTAVYFLDWHHLYDFYFEKKGNKVIVSNNRNGALTLSGTSTPLKFSKNDGEKLKFLLNKNKNKFVSKL